MYLYTYGYKTLYHVTQIDLPKKYHWQKDSTKEKWVKDKRQFHKLTKKITAFLSAIKIQILVAVKLLTFYF